MTFLMTQNSIINQLSKKYCQRYNLISRLLVVNPSSAFETVVLILDCVRNQHTLFSEDKSLFEIKATRNQREGIQRLRWREIG